MPAKTPVKWEEKTLSEICTIRPNKQEARNKLKDNELVSFVPMEYLGINQKYFESGIDKSLNEVVNSYTYFADKDVLLAKITPCFENGKLGIAKNLKNGIGFGSSEYIVFRPNENLDSSFLYYFLNREFFRQEGAQNMHGAVGHKRVAKKFIENYKIKIPDLTEQKRIVQILDKAFEDIDKLTQNAKQNLQNAKDLFDSYLASIFCIEDSCQEILLGNKDYVEIIDGDRGVNYPKKSDFKAKDYCLFLTTKNVRPDGFKFDEVQFITQEKDLKMGKGKLSRNDLIMTTRGTIGNLAVYDESIHYENIRINSGMLIFRVNQNKLLPKYLFEVFRSQIMKNQIEKYVSGAAQPQLPIRTLINFKIPVPNDLKEQQIIINKLKVLFSETKKLEQIYQQKIEQAEELKQSILQKAFNGEL